MFVMYVSSVGCPGRCSTQCWGDRGAPNRGGAGALSVQQPSHGPCPVWAVTSPLGPAGMGTCSDWAQGTLVASGRGRRGRGYSSGPFPSFWAGEGASVADCPTRGPCFSPGFSPGSPSAGLCPLGSKSPFPLFLLGLEVVTRPQPLALSHRDLPVVLPPSCPHPRQQSCSKGSWDCSNCTSHVLLVTK